MYSGCHKILSASSLSVEAVREAVNDFFMSIFGDLTAVSVNNATEKDYPATIKEEYAISNLPDGFELSDYNRDSGTIFAAYFNGDKYIFFEQFVHDSYSGYFDNEHSELEYYTDESGQEYLIQSTNHDFCIMWDNGRYILQIKRQYEQRRCARIVQVYKIEINFEKQLTKPNILLPLRV